MNKLVKKASEHISNSRSDINVAINEGLKMLRDDLKKEHLYIGKKDVDGNKIYADVSVVEFDMHGVKKTAYIAWDDVQLMYDFVFLDNTGFRCSYVSIYQKIYNLKVIGTRFQKDLK